MRIDTLDGALPRYTMHLTYGPGRSQVPTGQFLRPAQSVAEEATDRAHPAVVIGDLNAEPDSDVLRLLGGLPVTPAAPGLVLVGAGYYDDPADSGFMWDRHNRYQSDCVIPDSRIDYVLAGLSRECRGRVRSARDAGTALSTMAGHQTTWPSSPTGRNTNMHIAGPIPCSKRHAAA
jgi:endonuclease/exonuclease/phosphatase family metal-dependent hydrolase